jgi:hypothetical protein
MADLPVVAKATKEDEIGVLGESEKFEGVRGVSHAQVHGGVVGRNENQEVSPGPGVYGWSQGVGVYGDSDQKTGVYGHSSAGTGVHGETDKGTGVLGESRDWRGVQGKSVNDVGVYGQGGAYAGYFEGNVFVTGDVLLNGDVIVRDTVNGEALKFSSNAAFLTVGTATNPGDIAVLRQGGIHLFRVDGGTGDVIVRDTANGEALKFSSDSAFLVVGTATNPGDIAVLRQGGIHLFRIDGGTGEVLLRDTNNNVTIKLSSNTGDITATGDVCLVGADCAEDFNIAGVEEIEAGTVMVICQDGALRPSQESYDKRVAGVISGAGDFRSGIVLDKQAHDTETQRRPLALVGKVFCKVDASYAPIEVGDLLTTSPTPGHGMKAGDPAKAFGTVFGKALRGLESEQGLIPILVCLQ